MISNSPSAKGSTLIELVVYAALTAAIAAIVLPGVILLDRTARATRITSKLNYAAALSMERMVREIHDANSVSLASSTLGSDPGVLVINTDNASTTGGTMKFSLSNSQLYLTRGGSAIELSPPGLAVTSLVFYQYVAGATTSEGVRVIMKLADAAATSTNFIRLYGAAVLRGSYKGE